MPTAPRPNNKAKKIAYSILGKPANMQNKKTVKQAKRNKRLDNIDTSLVK